MLSLEGTGVKWHQLEGFPPAYVPICHMGMIEQKTSAVDGQTRFPSDLKLMCFSCPATSFGGALSANVLRQRAGLNERMCQVTKSKNKAQNGDCQVQVQKLFPLIADF